MPSSPRYDAIVVGGGLAGIATATWLAKRGRHVALVEPRSEWGGRFADQRVGGLTIHVGPRVVVSHERLGWADAYFEAIGLALPLLVREGTTFKREPLQIIWGPHRLTIAQQRADFVEELRREYRAGEPDVAALLADLDAVYDALAIRMDPPPSGDTRSSLARLRGLAAARAFAARFGTLEPTEYVKARGLAPALASYLESWRGALATEGDPTGAWLFRTALVHRGLVSVPGGRASVCRLLVARFQALGGEVLRTPVTAIGTGREPFVETDGRRLHTRALLINARRRPNGSAPREPRAPMATLAYTVPATCVPDAMGTYLLVADQGELWSVARRRSEGAQGSAPDLLTVSSRAPAAGRDVERISERVEALLPFAARQIVLLGAVRYDEATDPLDAKLWESASWRAGGDGWRQVSRSPVWWLPDESPPWLGDANEYRVALSINRIVCPP
ncbi:MAG: FAD-dependent oxidoreductase [Nitrospirota bacterium]